MLQISRSAYSARSLLPESTPDLDRHLSILIFYDVYFEYKGTCFNPGCLAIMLPTAQCKSRANAEGATVLVGWHVSLRDSY